MNVSSLTLFTFNASSSDPEEIVKIAKYENIYRDLPTISAKIALTNLPPQIRSILPPITIDDAGEKPYYETKYQIRSERTFRTLSVIFSNDSKKICSNKIKAALKEAEKKGFPVQSEKLFSLKENIEEEWMARIEGQRIKIRITPSQKELSLKAPRIILNSSFEDAFQDSLVKTQNSLYRG